MHMIKGIVCQFCLAATLATLGKYWIHKPKFLTMSVKVQTFAWLSDWIIDYIKLYFMISEISDANYKFQLPEEKFIPNCP